MLPDLIATVARVEEGLKGVAFQVTQVGIDQQAIISLLKGIAEQVRGASLPVLTMQLESVFVEGQPTTVMLRERQVNYLERHHLFAGRETELNRIRTFLAHRSRGYIFVTGSSGYGKTALLANLIAQDRERYAWYFLNQNDNTHRPREFLRQMCEQMMAYYQMPVQRNNDLPDQIDRLESLYSKLLRLPLIQPGKPLVLVIDGLDEAEGDFLLKEQHKYFPRELPKGKYIIFSARYTGRNYLGEMALLEREVLEIELEALAEDGIASLLRAASGEGIDWAQDPVLVSEVRRVSGGDPFYLQYLVQDIAMRRLSPDEITLRPTGLDRYLDRWFTQVENHLDRSELQDLIGFLVTAKGPIPRRDLAALLGTPGTLSRMIEPLRRFVVEGQDGLALCHPRFREYIERREDFLDILPPYADRLLRYCAKWQERKPPSRYALRHYASHLADADQWDALHQLLTTGRTSQGLDWAEVRHDVDGSYSGYLADLDLGWKHSEVEGALGHTTLGLQLQYALILATIRSLVSNVPPPLLVALVEKDVWTVEAGFEYFLQIPDPYNQVDVLAGLASHLPLALVRKAISIAKATNNACATAWLSSLTPRLAKLGFAHEALLTSLSIESEWDRAWILSELITYLPEGLLADALEATCALANHNRRLDTLLHFLPHLPEGLRIQAMHAALSSMPFLADQPERSIAVLVRLIPFLPELERADTLSQALAMAGTLEGYSRADALSSLAPLLDRTEWSRIRQEALITAIQVESASSRFELLLQLLPHLEAEEREVALERALEASSASKHEVFRVKNLARLIPLLAGSERIRVMEQILIEIRSTNSLLDQAESLSYLIPYLPLADYAGYIEPIITTAHASDAAREYNSQSDLAEVVAYLAPYLPETLLREALARLSSISWRWKRTEILGTIAPHLPASLLSEARALALRIGDVQEQSELLAELLSLLAALGYPERAIELVELIEDVRFRTNAIANLIPRLPQSLLQAAIEISQRIYNEHGLDWIPSRLAGCVFSRLIELGHVGEALELTRDAKVELWPSHLLEEFLPYLPEQERIRIVSASLAQVRRAPVEQDRVDELQHILHVLPEILAKEATEIVLGLVDGALRSSALGLLLPRLAKLGHVHQAILMVGKIEVRQDRVRVLIALIPYLQGSVQAQILHDVLIEARSVEPETDRARLLIALLPSLSEPVLTQTLQDILTTTRQIADRHVRSHLLAEVVPYLSLPLLKDLQAEMQASTDVAMQALILPALLARLAQIEGYSGAIAEAQSLEDEVVRATALTSLIPNVPEQERRGILSQALVLALRCDIPSFRLELLVKLAPHLASLQPSILRPIWIETLRVISTRSRKEVLSDRQALLPTISVLEGPEGVEGLAVAIAALGRYYP